ncbi:hypothetical protein ACGYLO_11195 [Sulfitobacter sp. 1A13353]|uniref:hypothetical protein n=1 Tax=Sulfitobacter sp. 1A13353 TaxID=3368568 RepID=UPI00374769E7
MPKFLDGSKLRQRLRTELRHSKSADIAVAFWGEGAADALGIQDGTKLRIVCNLMSGGTNPKEISKLQKRGAEVHQLNDLHAKIGVIGDMSFVGSSNMSANGLGAEGSAAHWQEANAVYSKARPEIAKMFNAYWEASKPITKEDLSAATAIWVNRQRGNAMVAARKGDRGLIDVLRAAPAELDALNVRMVVFDTMTDPDELEVLDTADRQAQEMYGPTFLVYWDWESMAKEARSAYLLSFDWPARRGIARGTLLRRNTEEFPDFEQNGSVFHPAYAVDSIEGITVDAGDKAILRKAFSAYVKDGATGEEGEDRAYNFPMSELAPYLPPANS